jgi:aspartate kinase
VSIRVQKYGGTSVSSIPKIKAIASRIADDYLASDNLVIVVSAMGKFTDDLTEQMLQISEKASPREFDKLLSTGETIAASFLTVALEEIGVPSISLSGMQAGLETDSVFSKASITHVDNSRIRLELSKRKVVVVAGFQGADKENEITTLGRGGSDTSAVALAASLKSDICEIYTDVDGVFSADPRLLKTASLIDEISYEEMLELSSEGARVIYNRAVELAWLYEIPILVASSTNIDRSGTIIHGGPFMEDQNKVKGIAHDTNVARVTVSGVPDKPGIAAKIFGPLAEKGISVDIIVQNTGHEGFSDMSFTVSEDTLDQTLVHVKNIAEGLGAREVSGDPSLAKVSIVGAGLQNSPGYAGSMFKALDEAGVNIEMITTAEISITCVVKKELVAKAVKALHDKFLIDN